MYYPGPVYYEQAQRMLKWNPSLLGPFAKGRVTLYGNVPILHMPGCQDDGLDAGTWVLSDEAAHKKIAGCPSCAGRESLQLTTITTEWNYMLTRGPIEDYEYDPHLLYRLFDERWATLGEYVPERLYKSLTEESEDFPGLAPWLERVRESARSYSRELIKETLAKNPNPKCEEYAVVETSKLQYQRIIAWEDIVPVKNLGTCGDRDLFIIATTTKNLNRLAKETPNYRHGGLQADRFQKLPENSDLWEFLQKGLRERMPLMAAQIIQLGEDTLKEVEKDAPVFEAPTTTQVAETPSAGSKTTGTRKASKGKTTTRTWTNP